MLFGKMGRLKSLVIRKEMQRMFVSRDKCYGAILVGKRESITPNVSCLAVVRGSYGHYRTTYYHAFSKRYKNISYSAQTQTPFICKHATVFKSQYEMRIVL